MKKVQIKDPWRITTFIVERFNDNVDTPYVHDTSRHGRLRHLFSLGENLPFASIVHKKYKILLSGTGGVSGKQTVAQGPTYRVVFHGCAAGMKIFLKILLK